MSMLKVIEVLAESDKSLDDAAQVAVTQAAETVRNIRSAGESGATRSNAYGTGAEGATPSGIAQANGPRTHEPTLESGRHRRPTDGAAAPQMVTRTKVDRDQSMTSGAANSQVQDRGTAARFARTVRRCLV